MKLQIPKKLLPLLKPKRFKIIHGGRGSTKSWTVAKLLLTKAISEKHRILCCREIQKSIKDSSKKLLEDEIKRMKLSNFFSITEKTITCIPTGTEFIFEGLGRNISSIKSKEGITITWVEEAESISYESLKYLIPTIRNDDSEIWFTFNLRFEEDAVAKRFIYSEIDPDTTLVIKINYDENPWFPDVLRTEMEWDKSHDMDRYLHIWEGEPVIHSDEQVFSGKWVVEDVHEPPDNTTIYYGSDFGFSNDPSTLVRCWIDDRDLYIDYEAYGHGIETDELPEFYKSVPGAKKWKIIADSARPDTISYIRRQGFNIEGSEKGKGSIEDGVAFLKSFRIHVHPRCKHTIDELKMYKYKRDPKTNEILPIIIDKNNHIIDPLRYATERARKNSMFFA